MDLSVSTRVIGSEVVVALEGFADLSTAPRLQDGLQRAVLDHPGRMIVVDLDGLVALDDTALGLLLGIGARARDTGGGLELVCTNAHTRSRLAATRLDRAVTVRSSVVDPHRRT